MEALYQRTAALLGEEAVERLRSCAVLVVGLGGVGGYIAESLARAGVGTLGICDFDDVDPTNLNRQILALNSTIGLKKTQVCAERIKDVNPGCNVKTFCFKLGADNINELSIEDWDYIADAIDDVPAKIALIAAAGRAGVPFITCMGTGGKIDPSRFRIADISKTHTDPLARSVRRQLRELGIEGVKALFSDEEPMALGRPVPSISYVPACAGLMIGGQIIRDLTQTGLK